MTGSEPEQWMKDAASLAEDAWDDDDPAAYRRIMRLATQRADREGDAARAERENRQ
ncbi:hypothetical protein [Kibdelosporangium phytohabitans]|uniref:hypothetical protein n=1 Tax=Kibdelosporangium phytohabitans TaxID=860235 RepID=UPI0012F9149D|nr:hypothetical protein [Kibdelosporangium phytohabitans]MBE1467576.1 hypothetical protein [Kibdelosporangium phytohabitans]